jgi:hypothetical protein
MKSREIRLTRHFTGPVLPEYFETAPRWICLIRARARSR